MIEKLEAIKERFQEVGRMLLDPGAMADMAKYSKLNKEYKELEKIVLKYNEYSNVLSNIESAKQVLEKEKDADFREMAKGELDELVPLEKKMEDELKKLLIPKDPNDGKDAILEIRAGTGGDEAAIFAGDLWRMYQRYSEKVGWKMSVLDLTFGTAGGYKEIICQVAGQDVYGMLKFESGGVDLAPTLLSLCGIEPPAHMQGHAFAGKFTAPRQDYVYGFRGRMDERYDMVRSVRDGRYVYIRNYMPHKIYGQHIDYMFQTPTTRVWKALFDAGKLNEAQSHFWKTKPAEELYDLRNDADEVNNLASSLQHQEILQRMRTAQQGLAVKIRDIGFLPEGEIHSRSEGSTPYETAHDDSKYPLNKIIAVAEQAASLKIDALDDLTAALADHDSAVRYWGAMGLLMRGETGVSVGRDPLRKALDDESPYVRIAAAEGLGRYGNKEDLAAALPVLLSLASPTDNGIYSAMAALNAIDYLDGNAASAAPRIATLPTDDPHADGRMKAYVSRLIEKTLADLN